MPEFRRYILTNQCYFVTTRVLNGEPIFKSPELCLILIDNLKFYREKMQFKIFGYVIMPDHFHGLIKPQDSVTVSDIMRSIKSYSSKQIAEVCGRKGSLWQSRFYEHVTRSEQDLLIKLEYIHNNPVRAGLVENPHDYEFSSYRCYHSESNVLLEVDKIEL